MYAIHLAIPVAVMLLVVAVTLPTASAQFQQGGVDHPGEWHAGENLKQGDYFSYDVCHVDYKECAKFTMNFWVKGEITTGTEEKWLLDVVVYDGNKVIVGDMELGKIAPEPTGGSRELGIYRSAFKSSIVWLSAFATQYEGDGQKGPKKFSAISWGKIANIGGEQILPKEVEPLTVPAGTWDETIRIEWKTGGHVSKIWIVDDFPFPIKGDTFTHVSEGTPPPEYKFELLEYKENVQQSPFEGIVSTASAQEAKGCQQDFEKVAVKKPTKNFQYQLHVFYGPEYPVQGCPMEWLIKFIKKVDDTEFLNQVQYNLLVVDDDNRPIRSLAQDEGRLHLYSPSGQSIVNMIVEEEPGIANYVIWVYGLAPEGTVPSELDDYLLIDIPISAPRGSGDDSGPSIPSWVKSNAGWWADGQIDDNTFVQGIQYLIKEGIMKIPPTTQGTGVGNNQIPSWVKSNAGWWADGQIDDNTFVQGIQYLIKEGIMKIPTQNESEITEAPPLWLG